MPDHNTHSAQGLVILTKSADPNTHSAQGLVILKNSAELVQHAQEITPEEEIKSPEATSPTPHSPIVSKTHYKITPVEVEKAKLRLQLLDLKLPPECSYQFYKFAFQYAHRRFVHSIQELNGNAVTRKIMENLWKSLIITKADLFKANGSLAKNHPKKHALTCRALRLTKQNTAAKGEISEASAITEPEKIAGGDIDVDADVEML